MRRDLVEHIRSTTDRIWIKDGLERLRRQRDPLEFPVALADHPELVSEWTYDVQLGDPADGRPLALGTGIRDVFNAAGHRGRVLVVGKPGSGKSTQLLELASSLLSEKSRDVPACPVVLLLSTWKKQDEPFQNWLFDQIERAYAVERDGFQELLDDGDITLILDGLDEINGLRSEGFERLDPRLRSLQEFLVDPKYARTGVALACRSENYQALGRRFNRLVRGVELLPLPRDLVARELSRGGPASARLADQLEKDTLLQDLLTTPLMLVLAISALSGVNPDAAELRQSDEMRLILLRLWEARMIHRERIPTRDPAPDAVARSGFTPGFTHEHLRSLAILMNRMGSTAIFPDELTPEWLPEVHEQALLPQGRPTGLFGRLTGVVGLDHASTGYVGGVLGFRLGLLFLAPLLVYALGPIVGGAMSVGAAALLSAAIFTTFGLARMRILGRSVAPILDDDENVPRLATHWIWVGERALRWVPISSILAAAAGGVVVLRHSLLTGATAAAALLACSVVGLGMSPIYEERPRYPGEALRKSGRVIRNVVAVTGAVALVLAAAVLALGGPWLAVLAVAMPASSLTMVFGPGRAWLRSRALAYGGSRSELLPADLAVFLEFASERALLLRSGGGYLFFHRIIQDYFASEASADLPPPPVSD